MYLPSIQQISKTALDRVAVKWRPLGEMAEIGTGRSNRQDESKTGPYPFYVRSHVILKASRFEFDEEAIIIPGEGGIGDIFHYAQGKYALHQRAYRICVTSNHLETKFLYYFMMAHFKHYILTKCVGATATSIRKPMLEKFLIPLPPLHAQQEIVRILDKFTELIATLTRELALRQQQYEYYRGKLLAFSQDKVTWKSLNDKNFFELANANRKPVKAGLRQQGHVPYYGANNIQDYVAGYTHQGEYVLIAEDGSANLHNYSIQYARGKFWANNHVHVICGKSPIKTRFLYHYLQNVNFIPFLTGGKRAKLTKGNLAAIKIPIPSIFEQNRLITILDKFETLTHSSSEGLPSEIALRQKQYQYYRQKLLTFSKI